MIFQGSPLSPPPDDLTIPQFLLDIHHPDRPIRTKGNPWLVDDPSGKAYVFEEVRSRVQGLANALCLKYAIKEDSVVCLFGQNHIDYPIALWAVHRLGAVVTTANPAFTSDELTYQLTTARATLVIANVATEATVVDAAEKAKIPRERIIFFSDHASSPAISNKFYIDDLIVYGNDQPLSFTERKLQPGEAKTKLALLSFSSGTTGRPKAVAIPHYSVISNVLQLAEFHRAADRKVPWEKRRFRPGDVAGGVLPLYHIYGLVVNLHFMAFCGLTVVLTPKFVFEDMLKGIERYRITHLFLAPPHIVLFCKHPAVKNYDLTSIRYAVAGAAPLSVELTLQFQKVLPQAEFGQAYGLTETCTALTMFPLSQRLGTPGSAGQLLPGIQAKIVKEDGTLCNYNEPGELVVKGPQLALGYSNNIQATKETFVDGWMNTGDCALITENCDVFIVDRLKEIFKVRGFQVAPAELEGHLLGHPDVGDAGVIGLPDEFSGEVPLAFIVLKADAVKRVTADSQEGERIKMSIIKHVADAKVKYKWLAGGVEFIDAIPKNPSGKILRRFLREKAAGIVAQRKSGRLSAAAKL